MILDESRHVKKNMIDCININKLYLQDLYQYLVDDELNSSVMMSCMKIRKILL
jgi:hypothetical protein